MAELEFPRWVHKASSPIVSAFVHTKEEVAELGLDWHAWKSDAVAAFDAAVEKAKADALALEAKLKAEAEAKLAAKKPAPKVEPEVKSPEVKS